MAWSQTYVASDDEALGSVGYPTSNGPDFAGDGIIIIIPQDAGVADGDVVVVSVYGRVEMSRTPYSNDDFTVGGGWVGIDQNFRFPCIGASSAQQDMTDYGATAPVQVVTCGSFELGRGAEGVKGYTTRSWVFQVTDATAHLTLGDYIINLYWDPGSAPYEYGAVDAPECGAILMGGVTIYRSDTNPTWPIETRSGTRACKTTFPMAGMTTGFDVYSQVGAVLGTPDNAPVSPSAWALDFVETAAIASTPYGVGSQYFIGTPSEDALWFVQDGGGTWINPDGTGLDRGSLYVTWRATDPTPEAETDIRSCFFRWDERWPDMLKTVVDGNGSQLAALGRTLEDRDQQLEDYIAGHFTCDCECEGGVVN